jgi:peptidoglycan/LPS O-acetylase OafA/YrhL
MNGVAKTLVDFWTSHWWQLYGGAFLAGIISTLGIALCTRDEQWAKRSGSLLRVLLFLGFVSMVTAIALTTAHHHESPWESLTFLYDHHLGFFVDGAVLTGLVVSLLRQPMLFSRKNIRNDLAG